MRLTPPLFALLLCANRAVAGEEQVEAYNTYLHPPFVRADGGGLAADLVARLNVQLAGKYQLRLVNLPRQRLMITHLRDARTFDGVGLMLTPAFVDSVEQPRFLWTQPVFHDYNVLVFPASAGSLQVNAADDLKGLRFGGVLGNRYTYLERPLATGQIQRQDTNSERMNLLKLEAGRIDFTQMNRLLYVTLAAEPEFAGRLEAVPEPGSVPFARRLFVGPHRKDLLASLNSALAALACDPQWRTTASHYRVTLEACKR